jgi:DNA-binding PadR family transcriptional regulator
VMPSGAASTAAANDVRCGVRSPTASVEHPSDQIALLRRPYYGERIMSDARLLALVSLSDGAKHGYSIQHDIDTFAGVRLGPGTLYGALASLERDRLIEALPSQERRRPYRLTDAGRRHLDRQLDELERIQQRAARVRSA